MAASSVLVCWKCGTSLAPLSLPLRRLDECPDCSAELHVCRMCTYFDLRVAKSCREPVADEVHDKERANFCGYFEPRPDAYRPPDADATSRARTELESLFGVKGADAAPADADDARAQLDALFDKK
ncbi:MAG: hypothetical protein ACREVN_06925 [Gammaproteobacteria bacterium]